MRILAAIKKFAYETFRPRTRADYAEVFSRGGGGDGRAAYPWLYSRALLLCFFLFALLSLGYALTGLNFLAVAAAGGAFADIAFIILLYELYPGRDFPLAAPFAAMFAGGILSSAAAYLLYSLKTVSAPYAMQAWTAFVEETAKAVAVAAAVAAAGEKRPFACLVLGAAVGGGFSAFENMWYAFTGGFVHGEVSGAVKTLLVRSFGTPFSHAAWAGAFGWAVSGEKPYKKWQPYAVFAFNFIMHFFVNFPLMEQFRGWKGYPISAVTGIATAMLLIFLAVCYARPQTGNGETAVKRQPFERLPKINSATGGAACRARGYKIAANAVAAAAVVCLSFALMGPALVFRGYETFKYYDFGSFEECRAVAQNGLEFYPDYDREYIRYDDLTVNYSVAYTEGQLSYVVQRERAGNYYYRYRYAYTYYIFTAGKGNVRYIRLNGRDVPAYEYLPGEGTGRSLLENFEAAIPVDEDGNPDYAHPSRMRRIELKSVSLEYNGGVYQDYALDAGGEKLHTFILNPLCYSVYVTDDGVYRAVMEERTPLGVPETVVFCSVFAAATAGLGAAWTVLKIKSGKYPSGFENKNRGDENVE